jgi:hypothetical protein
VLPSHPRAVGTVRNFLSVGFNVGIAVYGGTHDIKDAHFIGNEIGIYSENTNMKVEDIDIE